MILINEPYTLKPEKIRAGENILNTITTYGGYRTNIQINNDGTGEIGYNNSDYTISLNNDLIVGGTSTFTISNVTNNDTVEFYEDSVLISSTTGNTVTYTPTTAGEHLIYFRINNTPTNSMKVTVYTVNNLTVNLSAQTINGATYCYARGINLQIKPIILEGGTLNNIPCTINYGDRTQNITVPSTGTTINVPPLNNPIGTKHTLKIIIGERVHNITNLIEYYDIYIDDPNHNYIFDLRNIIADADFNVTNNGLKISNDGNPFELIFDEYLSSCQLEFKFGSQATLKFVTGVSSTINVTFNAGDTMSIIKGNGSVTLKKNSQTVSALLPYFPMMIQTDNSEIIFTRILTGAY